MGRQKGEQQRQANVKEQKGKCDVLESIAQDLGEEAVAEHALVIVEADIGPRFAEVGAGEIGQAEDEKDDGRKKEEKR